MSQFGADRWVLHNVQGKGFYVDVGCHDGVDISNTYELDKAGWDGICIDPFPKNFETRTARVVKACVYSSNGHEVEFDYSLEDPGSELGNHKNRLHTTTTIQKHTFKTRTLESILDEMHAPRKIEYMNLDIEGSEFEVLRVFPFSKYMFKLLTIEHNYEEPKRTQIRHLLESHGYVHTLAVHVDDWYVHPKWSKAPRVILSLTSIPPRFKELRPVLESLIKQTCHEIWLNIPPTYTRFPEWDGRVPDDLCRVDPKVVINRDCEDLGPGTKFIGSALKAGPDDLIVYLDDDTAYDSRLVTNLLKWYRTDPASAWGLSGFTFENYFKGHFPREHGASVDVLEGYGAVIVRAKWIQDALPEFKELLDVTWHDDMILCNLLEKAGVKRRTIHVTECHLGLVRQSAYGFDENALHHVAGPGGHMANNLKILQKFKDKGKMYYRYTGCS